MMTLTELLQDESLRRREFPIANEQIYLAHAGVSPLPNRVAEKMMSVLVAAQSIDQDTAARDAVEATRRSVADLLGVLPEEVALTGATSNALSLVASGFPFREGDNAVMYRDSYPSDVYPWLALESRGVEVRTVHPSRLGRIAVSDVLAQIDGRTRLVALDSCHFLTGLRLDVTAIGAALRSRGVAFCVDGIQTVGAFPLDLESVDFMAAGAHKWLLGPSGSGVLYVSRDWQDRLRPNGWGWHNLACSGFAAMDRLEYRSSARRYEPGTANLVGIAGLGAAVDLIREIGVPEIARELARKRVRLAAALAGAGFDILDGTEDASSRGGMLTVTHPERDLEERFRVLGENQVQVSLRTFRSAEKYLRFSPHFYNTDRELDTAIELLLA